MVCFGATCVAPPALAQGTEASLTTGTLFCSVLAVALVAAVGALIYWIRRARQAVQFSGLLQSAYDAANAGLAVVDGAGSTVAVNRHWRRTVLGDGRDATIDLRELVPETEAARAWLDRLLADGGADGPTGDQIVFTDESGHRRALDISIRPVPNSGGARLVRVADAAARLELNESLVAAAKDFDRVIGDGPIGLIRTDGDGTVRYVNAAVADWIGAKPEDLCGGRTRLADLIRDAATPKAALKPRDGAPVPVEICSPPFERAANPDERRYLLHRREPEASAEEGIERLYADFPIGIVFTDAAGNVSDCNPAFFKMADIKRSDAVGHPLTQLFDETDRQNVADWMAGENFKRPLEARLGADGKSMVSVIAGRLQGDEGIILHVVDLTDQKNLEEQVFQKQKMELVGQLAGGVAHDFNNLLTAIIGFCDLLLQRHSPKDQSFADINQIKQNANRAANLVRQLLAFSRQQTLQPKVLSLTDVLAELSYLLRRLIGANIELEMHHSRDLGRVKADQGQLEQVVINLAVNARDAMADGGTLTIRTRTVGAADKEIATRTDLPPADYVVLEVADTGCGIAKEHLDKIFEPFFTTKEVGQGTGLGLSTVYGIVKQTGGHIYVDSKPGEGATFAIYLPRFEGAEDSAADKAMQEETAKRRDLTGNGTILLVEDEDAVRLFGARALRNKGYDVVEASNGAMALEILNDDSQDFDILISDVVMPGVDGPTLIREVRERNPDMKVIFISGYTEDSFRQKVDAGAVVHFLAKPFSLQQLATKVKEVMHA